MNLSTVFKVLPVSTLFAVIAFIIAALAGWVMNIIALVHSIPSGVDVLLVLRVVGIPVGPLGVVLGWFF